MVLAAAALAARRARQRPAPRQTEVSEAPYQRPVYSRYPPSRTERFHSAVSWSHSLRQLHAITEGPTSWSESLADLRTATEDDE